MKTIILGLGIQGKKRKKFLKNDFFAFVDPYNNEAEYAHIEDVPLNKYDAVLACVPDKAKLKILEYCIKYNKHILIEKPLIFKQKRKILELEKKAIANKTFVYVAYNHRFEPHIINMKKLLEKKEIGKIYYCKMFYGNGTSKLINKSSWRKKDSTGVITDLGSHLLDICNYWFGQNIGDFRLSSFNHFETRTVDHAILINDYKKLKIHLEMTYCMWKNSFFCDIIGEKGSAHINSFCKWGPSKFIKRTRKLPSGAPKEKTKIVKRDDPTWLKEYSYFKKMILMSKKTNFSKDVWLHEHFKSSIKKNKN